MDFSPLDLAFSRFERADVRRKMFCRESIMKTTHARQSKPLRKPEPAPSDFLPCDILLEQAQICCYQAREAARLSRQQAARGLLQTAQDLLHRAATTKPRADAIAPLAHETKASSAAAACSQPQLLARESLAVDHRLSLRLSAGHNSHNSEQDLLLQALESQTGTPWRWAGDILAVEQQAPHRVIVLRGLALEAWRSWRGVASEREYEPRECELQVELFAPISGGPGGLASAGCSRAPAST